MKKFSAIVKVFLISILLSVNSFADDFLKSESYTPGGEYRLFGSGRGSVSNIRGGFNESWQFGITAGNIAVNNLTYTGTVDYQQDFSGHGHKVHAPFSSTSSKFVENKSTSPDDGLKLSSVYVKGREIHPADGYDGPQGGGYPKPTGARDEYHYDVTAHVTTIKVVSIEKLNQVLPPERKITETERKKLQNGEKLSQERYIELIITAENNKDFLQPEKVNRYSFEQTGLKELTRPESMVLAGADEHGWFYYLGDAALDILPGTSDYRAWKEADGFWDKSWVVATATPLGKYAKTGRQVLKTADELNDVRKAKNAATGVKNTEKSAGKVTESATAAKNDPVLQALEQATPTPGKPNQLETKLDDGSKVIFRKDFGENAHPLNDPNGKLTGKGNIDHYNIEIHTPSTTKPGRFNQEVDWHIVPNGNGSEPIKFPTYPGNKRRGK